MPPPSRTRPGTALAGAALLLTMLGGAAGVASTASAGASSCDPALPFRNPGLPLNTRVSDLTGRLSTAQKVSLLHQYEPAIGAPLCLPAFKTGTEALHGVAWSTDKTSGGAVVDANGTTFPQAVGLASTWDPALMSQVGNAVGQDARGYNKENPTVWGRHGLLQPGQHAAQHGQPGRTASATWYSPAICGSPASPSTNTFDQPIARVQWTAS